MYKEISKKIRDKSAIVTVMGLGYVGLPIALELNKKGYGVIGLDNNKKRIRDLIAGRSYVEDIKDREVKEAKKTGRFKATWDKRALGIADIIIMCVPTPLRKTAEPDISYILDASISLAQQMKKGQLIVVESTTYPGTTRELILPELEKSGLKLDEDFFLAFSPERIDPGNPKYTLTSIPKVVGGLTEKSTELSKRIYSKIIKKVIPVSSSESAEVTKLLENTFRIVNIALINEFAMLCHKLGIDVWEVIDAAKTKPFGFMPFYPGPGIGGHCIPADPMYLSWKAKTVGFETKIIDLAADVNRMVPKHIVGRLGRIMRKNGKSLKGANILIIGVAYKKDVNDVRESPALEIIENLKRKKAKVVYHDAYIPELRLNGKKMKSVKLSAQVLKKQDVVLIVADHTSLNYKMIAKNSDIIFDTRHAMASRGIEGDNIYRL